MKTKTFLRRLSETSKFFNREWKMYGDDGYVRMFIKPTPDGCFCPITAVCKMLKGAEFHVWDAPKAGKVIGLSNKQIHSITAAADFPEDSDPKLRGRLLEAICDGQGKTKNQKTPPTEG